MSVMTTHPPIPRPSAPRRLPRGVIVCAAGITVGLLAVVLLPGAAFADEVRDGQWYLDTLNVHDAHELSQGAGVTIGVIDTGVDAGHVDFDGRVVGGTDLIYSDRDGLSDDYGHGTSVASVLIGDTSAGFPAALPRVIPVTATARDSKFMSASIVAGTLALIKSAYPDLARTTLQSTNRLGI